MNERIKELANSVGLFMQLPSGPYPVQMTAEESVEAYKKFAELIVRECIAQCNDGDSRYFIATHFGVER